MDARLLKKLTKRYAAMPVDARPYFEAHGVAPVGTRTWRFDCGGYELTTVDDYPAALVKAKVYAYTKGTDTVTVLA